MWGYGPEGNWDRDHYLNHPENLCPPPPQSNFLTGGPAVKVVHMAALQRLAQSGSPGRVQERAEAACWGSSAKERITEECSSEPGSVGSLDIRPPLIPSLVI